MQGSITLIIHQKLQLWGQADAWVRCTTAPACRCPFRIQLLQLGKQAGSMHGMPCSREPPLKQHTAQAAAMRIEDQILQQSIANVLGYRYINTK